MINSLSREIRALQNPALGAALLWRSSVAYAEHNNGSAIPLPYLFLILPITLHKPSAELLTSTRIASGLRMFTEKFYTSSESKTDLLLGISKRAAAMRKLSLDSLQLALAKRLVALDVDAAAIFPLSKAPPIAGIPPSVRTLLSCAAKLGTWFSEITLYEAALLLQIEF
jgi:hypothetical protein